MDWEANLLSDSVTHNDARINPLDVADTVVGAVTFGLSKHSANAELTSVFNYFDAHTHCSIKISINPAGKPILRSQYSILGAADDITVNSLPVAYRGTKQADHTNGFATLF
jgi:hypothetical protein